MARVRLDRFLGKFGYSCGEQLLEKAVLWGGGSQGKGIFYFVF